MRWALGANQLWNYIYLGLYFILLTKSGTNFFVAATGICFALWLKVGIIMGLVNFHLANGSMCSGLTKYGAFAVISSLVMLLVAVGTTTAAWIFMCKLGGVCSKCSCCRPRGSAYGAIANDSKVAP